MIRSRPVARAILVCTALALAACTAAKTTGTDSADTSAAAAKGAPFGAALSGRAEAPPANSRVATGTAKASYDNASRLLTWDVTFGGLTSDATAAHIHGPAAPGANAPVVLALTPRNMYPIASPLRGSARLTDAQAADLMAGKWYVNIHTVRNPNGELRGQLMPQ
jgi:hypothetical protein